MDRQVVRGVSVVGEGSVEAPPDTAYATIGIDARGTSLLEAQREAARGMASVVGRLRMLGIAEADLQALAAGAWQDQDEAGGFVVANYTVSNRVRVRVRDVGSLLSLLEAATEAGATGVQGVGYAVEDRRAIEARAREEAMRDAGARAAELARLGGLALAGPVSITELAPDQQEDEAIDPGPPPGVPHVIEPYEVSGVSGWTRARVRLRVVYSVE